MTAQAGWPAASAGRIDVMGFSPASPGVNSAPARKPQCCDQSEAPLVHASQRQHLSPPEARDRRSPHPRQRLPARVRSCREQGREEDWRFARKPRPGHLSRRVDAGGRALRFIDQQQVTLGGDPSQASDQSRSLVRRKMVMTDQNSASTGKTPDGRKQGGAQTLVADQPSGRKLCLAAWHGSAYSADR